ncbi:hypothetical protein, partial [Zhongshania sp.]|uniref:hypothetical protein n=1 Tax=Zhongshania sp. TaxID=1971902 RepID=UPI00356A77FE
DKRRQFFRYTDGTPKHSDEKTTDSASFLMVAERGSNPRRSYKPRNSAACGVYSLVGHCRDTAFTASHTFYTQPFH